MSVENWGLLSKSQVDPSTVDDAIAAAIQAHNDDPDAHLGTGQSLQSHRASDIIDHLAHSVVTDKIGYDKLRYTPSYETLDLYSKTAGVELWPLGNIVLGSTPSHTGNQYLKLAYPEEFDYASGADYYPFITCACRIPTTTDIGGFLLRMETSGFRGYGFEFNGSHVYCAYWDTDSEIQESDPIDDIDVTEFHQYTCFVNEDDELVWQVDDVIIQSVPVASIRWPINTFVAQVEDLGSAGVYMSILPFTYYQDSPLS